MPICLEELEYIRSYNMEHYWMCGTNDRWAYVVAYLQLLHEALDLLSMHQTVW